MIDYHNEWAKLQSQLELSFTQPYDCTFKNKYLTFYRVLESTNIEQVWDKLRYCSPKLVYGWSDN